MIYREGILQSLKSRLHPTNAKTDCYALICSTVVSAPIYGHGLCWCRKQRPAYKSSLPSVFNCANVCNGYVMHVIVFKNYVLPAGCKCTEHSIT